MRTRLTLHPDQDGAKQLRARYGERLVCVRYRYDETTKERWKTVELIIEKRNWEPSPPRQPEDAIVAIQVAAQEREVRRQVKAVSGKWNPRQVVWELPYGHVVALGLTDRIVTKTEGEEERMDHLHIESAGKESPSTYR
jgi:hypothetical protein